MVVTNQKEKTLVWIGSSKKDLVALPVGVRKFFGHALDFAQRGEQHVAAKVLKGFGGCGRLGDCRKCARKHVPCCVHCQIQGGCFRVACVPEKEQVRYCNTKTRDGYYPRATESCRKTFKGDA